MSMDICFTRHPKRYWLLQRCLLMLQSRLPCCTMVTLFAEVVDERLQSRPIEGQLHPHIHLSDGHTLLKKSLLHSGMRYLFGNYSYSICLWGLKAGWLAGFIIFLCIVCTFLLNVYFGKFVITFIDIGEIVCMSKPKYHWMVIVVNLVKQTWIFAFFAWCCLLVWFCVCWVSIGYSHL